MRALPIRQVLHELLRALLQDEGPPELIPGFIPVPVMFRDDGLWSGSDPRHRLQVQRYEVFSVVTVQLITADLFSLIVPFTACHLLSYVDS